MLFLEEANSDPTGFRKALAEGAPFRPLYVKIKLTWRCNLRCQMCNVWRQSREDRLTLPFLQSLADELAHLGTRKVHLSGGEVLLRPDVFEVIKAFAEQGIQVNLTTNGTLLTPEVAARLVESGVNNVSVSLDGATPSVHDKLRGPGNWKRTLMGIHNLRKAAKAAGRKVHIRINAVITRRNYRDLASLPEIAHHAGADRLTLIPVDDPEGHLRLNKQRIREYTEEIAPLIADRALAYGLIEKAEEVYVFGREKAQWEWSKRGLYALGLYEKQPCYMPWLHALIEPRGHLYPCCMMRSLRPLGNVVKAQGFSPVWEGEAFRSFRLRLLEPQTRPHLCHQCDDFLQENQALHRMLSSSESQEAHTPST